MSLGICYCPCYLARVGFGRKHVSQFVMQIEFTLCTLRLTNHSEFHVVRYVFKFMCTLEEGKDFGTINNPFNPPLQFCS